jgi:hypothetical protein
MNSTSPNYLNIQSALRRYNIMVERDHGAGRRTIIVPKIPWAAWLAISERLLTAMTLGPRRFTPEELRFVKARATDAWHRSTEATH